MQKRLLIFSVRSPPLYEYCLGHLPGAGNPLIDAINRAEEIDTCTVGYGPFGIGVGDDFPMGIEMYLHVEPNLYFGTYTPDPEKPETFTARFVAYTFDSTGICYGHFLTPEETDRRHILTAEELDQLACLTDDAHEREIIQAVKELTSFQIEMSEEEYKQAEDAVYDRTVKESEEVDESLQNGEKPEDAPEMEETEEVGPSLTNLSL
ncbi:hypothetical protein [Anaerotruncus colihominis]|uniref:hypothetical protein n=1 Tax=Anaerotruncus colihominis TaxID=169435 RepID=UPI00189973A8|nr:hypothetical protein [Anaerotruncus colihominis]